jgi:CubicO group peptidase (beta-lactamase class C family)
MKKIAIPTIYWAIVCFCLAFAFSARGENVPPLLIHKDVQAVASDLQTYLPQLLEKARIPGLQIALIRDGKIAWHQNFGVKNAKTLEPVTDETIFEAASLTKPFFAYYVMKLVDHGVIDLNKPLLGYVPRGVVEKEIGHSLDEAGFRRDWLEKVTARHVLSHSSGLPHGESGKPYPLFFEPGTKWRYSAEGYYLLQKAVEQLKGDKLENLMQKEVLNPLGMTRSCLVWREDYEKSMANGHDHFSKPEEFRKRQEAHAGATLYTTAEDYAKFVCAMLNGAGLRPETLKEMLTPQIDMDKEKGVGWSLGFGTQTDSNGLGFWQWGDYGIFRNYIIAYPKEKMGVVYLANSFYGLSIVQEIISHSLGGVGMGGLAMKFRTYDSPVFQFAWDLLEKGPRAIENLKSLMDKNPGIFDRYAMGFLSDIFLQENLMPQAVALLEFNAEEHPLSGTAKLELARAYILTGNKEKAKLLLEETRAAAEDKVEPRIVDWNLEYLRALAEPFSIAAADLEKLAGDYQVRHVQFRDGRLEYLRRGGAYPNYRRLVPFAKDTFMLEGMPSFRLKFEFDASGNPIKAVGLYEDGRQDETTRGQ